MSETYGDKSLGPDGSPDLPVGAAAIMEGKVVFPTGELDARQLAAVLKLIPADLTFVDANDRVVFFALGCDLFPRPMSCLGASVYDCHPERSRDTVRRMLDTFKDGRRDLVDMWTKGKAGPIRVRYCAVRDDEGNYLGALEIAQPFGDVIEHLGW